MVHLDIYASAKMNGRAARIHSAFCDPVERAYSVGEVYSLNPPVTASGFSATMAYHNDTAVLYLRE